MLEMNSTSAAEEGVSDHDFGDDDRYFGDDAAECGEVLVSSPSSASSFAGGSTVLSLLLPPSDNGDGDDNEERWVGPPTAPTGIRANAGIFASAAAFVAVSASATTARMGRFRDADAKDGEFDGVVNNFDSTNNNNNINNPNANGTEAQAASPQLVAQAMTHLAVDANVAVTAATSALVGVFAVSATIPVTGVVTASTGGHSHRNSFVGPA